MTGFERRLIAAAAAPYRRAGRYAWHFALGKLRRDPVFSALLRDGLLPSPIRLLDLGCGQGLLASWLHAAAAFHDQGDWPEDWPAPPRLEDYRGIELRMRDVMRARRALPSGLRIEHGDIRERPFARAGLVVILDVLHYIQPEEQRRVLERVRDCLAPGGGLLIRVGDAAGGLSFLLSLAVDVMMARLRRLPPGLLHCRSLADWETELEGLGFRVRVSPMSVGTSFANHLLIAQS